VRTEGNAAAPLELVGRRAQAAHPTVALVERRTMAEGVGVMLLPFEIGSMLGLALGAAAMALAAVGLHGIVAFAVAARTREFGLRLALGATGRQIVGAATSEVRRATAAGLAIGVAIAAIGSQLLSGFMMGVSSFDAMAFAGGVALTIAVAAIAAAAPARRATRIDPIAALRE
jgi:ABC-type antimicrobial peptide transport system permease subunit